MPSLRETQSAMAAALRQGPAQVPAGMFAGTRCRTLLAFAAHANTISHGRLVALEDTFPQARAALGAGEFNRLSRAYLDRGEGCDVPLNRIGQHFPDFLEPRAPAAATIAARFDLARLAAYHAAEAPALDRAALTGAAGADVLALAVCRHPGARLVAGEKELTDRLGLPGRAYLLITRPEASIRIAAVAPHIARIFAFLSKSMPLRNLFALAAECMDEALVPTGVMTLIEAGSLGTED